MQTKDLRDDLSMRSKAIRQGKIQIQLCAGHHNSERVTINRELEIFYHGVNFLVEQLPAVNCNTSPISPRSLFRFVQFHFLWALRYRLNSDSRFNNRHIKLQLAGSELSWADPPNSCEWFAERTVRSSLLSTLYLLFHRLHQLTSREFEFAEPLQRGFQFNEKRCSLGAFPTAALQTREQL